MSYIQNDMEMKLKPRDLLQKLSLEEQTIPLNIQVPDGFYQILLEQLLERDYLNYTSDKVFYKDGARKKIQWMQITRLPVHPNENESYDLLSRWQGALSTMHIWNYRLIFLLLRYEGETHIYLGTTSSKQEISTEEAVEQLREATFGSMPGIGLQVINKGTETEFDSIYGPLNTMDSVGAVTGIPSLRSSDQNQLMQTLDQLAFGIRDIHDNEKNYALLVIADPIADQEISDVISRHRRLVSSIHTAVKRSGSQGSSRNEQQRSRASSVGGVMGGIMGAVAGSLLGNPLLGAGFGSNIGGIIGNGYERDATVGGSASVSMEFLDKFAEYAEEATNHHIQRLNEGRNLGFWNTGIYVLGELPRDVMTVTGMLRSIYSGDETYFEPIRMHLFSDGSHAREIVRDRFELLPMLDINIMKPDADNRRKLGKFDYKKDEWHIFGKNYQYLSTPLNTKELALATSLPRRDVPGLRFVKTAVRFANNPGVIERDRIRLGNIVDTGIVQNTTYDIDMNSLVRHTLVSGITGSGKSTTCKRILTEVIRRKVPVLILEPAKDDYVRWAIEMNRSLPEEQQFRIYMPGIDRFEQTPVIPLRINPFEPAAIDGARVDLLQHSEKFATLLNACLPSEEVVPILIEEVVYETIRSFALANNRRFNDGQVEPLADYPNVDDMVYMADEIMRKKKYAVQNKDNLSEILITRFKSLQRGTRGAILNVRKSVSYEEMFSHNVIINVSMLSGSKDKALVMSLLMQALYEYRVSCYTQDTGYRKKAQQNRLLHLALIEEAHNVLMKPNPNLSGGNPQQAAADLFGNMLSEVRGYGQGLIVVDQTPTRLIDDAIKNTNYKIVHRLTAPDDQEVMASSMAFREEQKYIIPALEKGNAIICGDEDDAAAWVRIQAPEK